MLNDSLSMLNLNKMSLLRSKTLRGLKANKRANYLKEGLIWATGTKKK